MGKGGKEWGRVKKGGKGQEGGGGGGAERVGNNLYHTIINLRIYYNVCVSACIRAYNSLNFIEYYQQPLLCSNIVVKHSPHL